MRFFVVGKFRLCRRFFVWFVLFYAYLHGAGVSRFSCDVKKKNLGSLSAICVFFDISSEHYRLKRFLEKEANTNFPL